MLAGSLASSLIGERPRHSAAFLRDYWFAGLLFSGNFHCFPD